MKRTIVLALTVLSLFTVNAGAVSSKRSTQGATTPQGHPQPRPYPSQHPMRVGRMNGRYYCAQGWTNLQLQITAVRGGNVEAVFSFEHSPTIARGEFSMAGVLEANGALTLSAVSWINRPPGYAMVSMSGIVQANGVYSGRILDSSCGEFTVSPSGI